MISIGEYLLKAAEFLSRVDGDTDPLIRAEFENLAKAYLRLAELAKQNTRTDVAYEPPSPKIDDPEVKQ